MFFAEMAHAMAPAGQGAQQGGAGGLMSLAPFLIMLVIMYFILIRPQQKKAKEHKQFLANLKRGDKILTGAGFYGEIVEVRDDRFKVKLAEGLVVELNRNYVAGSAETPAGAGKGEKKAVKAEKTEKVEKTDKAD